MRKFHFAVILALFSMLITSNALAFEVTNKSDTKIGAALIVVEDERKTPIFIKVLDPGASMSYTPEVKGPFLASVVVFGTNETFRLEGVNGDESLVFNGKKLKRK